MICPQCRNTVQEDILYCAFCGHPLERPEAAVTPEFLPATEPEPLPVMAPPETTPGLPLSAPVPQPFFPPASFPPAPYPAYTTVSPVVYPPDFPKTTVRRLTHTRTFKAGLIFTVLSFLFTLALVILTVAAGPSLLRSNFFDFTQSYDSLYALIAYSCTLATSLVLIVALVRLSHSHKSPDLPLVKALGLLTVVPIVACVGSIFSNAVRIFLVDFPVLYSTLFDPYAQNIEWAYWPIAVLVILVTAAILIPLYCLAFSGFRNIRDAVKTGIPNAKFSAFIAVMLFIFAFSSILTVGTDLLSYFGENLLNFTGLYTRYYGIVDLISPFNALFSALSSLLLGLTLRRYINCTKKGILP